MPVVALRVMIVINNRGRLLTCTNEGEPIPNTFRMAIITLNFPQYDLVEIPSFVSPLSPYDQFGRRHREPPLHGIVHHVLPRINRKIHS
jgi:hypothetical protein